MTLQKSMHVEIKSTLSNNQSIKKKNHKKNYKTFREKKAQNVISLDAVKAALKEKFTDTNPYK